MLPAEQAHGGHQALRGGEASTHADMTGSGPGRFLRELAQEALTITEQQGLEQQAVQAAKAGAFCWLVSPSERSTIVSRLGNKIETHRAGQGRSL